MYAIELLKMIENFEEKYPEIDLNIRGLYLDVTGNSNTSNHGYLSSYEIGLEYIKFKTKKSIDNRIRIPKLKSILKKVKYKKLHIEIINYNFSTKVVTEIPWLELRSNICHSTDRDKSPARDRYVYREEIKND